MILPLLLALAATASPSDCEVRLQQKLLTDLELDYQTFDQTPDSGFRTLAADCPQQAGDLLEAWMQRNGEPSHSLRWHLAQTRAEAGQTTEAITAARASLRPNEPQDAAFRWNDYVQAVIAFLQNDRERFDQHRNNVAAGVEAHQGNGMNLKLLDQLGAGFGKGYREALASP
jgi:hypothetical protein